MVKSLRASFRRNAVPALILGWVIVSNGCILLVHPIAGRPSEPLFQAISNLEATTIGKTNLSDLVGSFGQPVVLDADQHRAVSGVVSLGLGGGFGFSHFQSLRFR